ncbi:MAG TPA: ABC transporter permease subunit [Bryobacteraceae bacterium]|nr:ABC transporter permease subunit [Bryobacteraceae bacterium]
MNKFLVIARKEIVDSMRDVRSVLSSLMFSLMGPVVVGLVSFAPGMRGPAQSPIGALLAVFTLVSAFSGGMNVAIDMIAGERERRSLLPLLLNAVPTREIAFGKWLAVSFFALAGLIVNLSGSAIVFAMCGLHAPASWPYLALAIGVGILPLAFLGAAAQLWLCTFCRSAKEAHTYLSMLVFLPMGIGMLLVFIPAARQPAFEFLPLLGQQLSLLRLADVRKGSWFVPLVLGYLTLFVASILMLISSERLKRDEIIYGS